MSTFYNVATPMGWKVALSPSDNPVLLAVTVRVTCHHGHVYIQTASYQLVEQAPPEYLANEVLRAFHNECKAGHPSALKPGAFIPPTWMMSKYAKFTPAASQASPANAVVDGLAEIIPGIGDAVEACPDDECITPDRNIPIAVLIVHLNDVHRWTRERIADWLDSLDIDLTIQRKDVA